jgi:hypothetical protein
MCDNAFLYGAIKLFLEFLLKVAFKELGRGTKAQADRCWTHFNSSVTPTVCILVIQVVAIQRVLGLNLLAVLMAAFTMFTVLNKL